MDRLTTTTQNDSHQYDKTLPIASCSFQTIQDSMYFKILWLTGEEQGHPGSSQRLLGIREGGKGHQGEEWAGRPNSAACWTQRSEGHLPSVAKGLTSPWARAEATWKSRASFLFYKKPGSHPWKTEVIGPTPILSSRLVYTSVKPRSVSEGLKKCSPTSTSPRGSLLNLSLLRVLPSPPPKPRPSVYLLLWEGVAAGGSTYAVC